MNKINVRNDDKKTHGLTVFFINTENEKGGLYRCIPPPRLNMP